MHDRSNLQLRIVLILAIGAIGLLVITSRADNDEVSDAQRQKDRNFIEILSRVESIDLNANDAIKQKVLGVLSRNTGTPLYLDVVERYELSDEPIPAELLKFALEKPTDPQGVRAARLLLETRGVAPFKSIINDKDAKRAASAINVLARTADRRAYELLSEIVTDKDQPRALRTAAVLGFAHSLGGQKRLFKLVEAGKLDKVLHIAAGNVLLASPDPAVQKAAGEHLTLPASVSAKPLPPIAELVTRRGDPVNGPKIMRKTQCFTCHKVGDEGHDVGPGLTEIGSKLSRDAMYLSILDPSAGIEHNYDAWHVETEDGQEFVGLIISETDDAVTVRVAGGVTTKYLKSDIYRRRKLDTSLMPPNIQQAMTEQELVDLVEYLMTLKKK